MIKPNPNYLCDSVQSLLFIVDIQERLTLAMPGKVIKRVLKNTSLLAQCANLLDIPIIVSEQNSKSLGGTERSILPHIQIKNSKYIFNKTTFSVVNDANIMAAIEMKNKPQIILVGMEAHICILQTAVDLMVKGYTVFVAEDSICSRSLENYQNALSRIKQLGITTTCAESIIFEWLGNSQNPKFKEIQAIIK